MNDETKSNRRLPLPTREQIEALEPFEAIGLGAIVVATTKREIEQGLAELTASPSVGFDTESRPTFRRGEVSDGPHVVQFATPERAWIFQLGRDECRSAVVALLESEAMTKVGFGLAGDRKQILDKLGVQPHAVLDLGAVFRQRGYVKTVGVKTAVAIVLNRRFSKSKKASTSNWSSERLSERQLLYAANDAYAAIRVYRALVSGNLTQGQPPIGCQ